MQRTLGTLVLNGLMSGIVFSAAASAQNMSTGSVTVTVQDPSGASVPGATLTLRDLSTNDVRTSSTRGGGPVTYPDLNFGHYSLTISKEGFATKVYSSVLVQTNQVTAISAQLAMGNVAEQVTVSAESTPLLDTTSNTLSTTIDLKQVQDLPIQGRDTFSLSFLGPGAIQNDINNLPGGAVNTSLNGFSSEPNRFKSGGFDTNGPAVTARLEDVQEMTIESGELDASKGGTAAMDIGFATRRGTNRFHGSIFEDYRNDALNANSWVDNYVGLRRPKLIINDFGGSVGGPIWKDRLFFFASLANFRQPSKFTQQTTVATPLALSGVYQYYPTGSSTLQSINVFQAAGSAGFANTVNPTVQAELNQIQSTYSMGTLTPLDPNHDTLSFLVKDDTIIKYPTARIDYNVNPNFRITGSATETATYDIGTGALSATDPEPPYPGPAYANQDSSYTSKGYQVVAGFDWNITPAIVNALRVGYLYSGSTYDSQGIEPPPAGSQDQAWGFGLVSGVNAYNYLKGGSLYPVGTLRDDTTWQKGRHTMIFGGEVSTEIDHYYNNQFVPTIYTNALASGDPVSTPLDAAIPAGAPTSVQGDVEGLYSTLTGRISGIYNSIYLNTQTKQYQPGISFDLHERLTQSALFFEDSWRATTSLTLNAGLRWDFTGASTDETGYYSHPTVAGLWGPSGVGNLFQPGVLPGEMNPVETPSKQAYAPTYVHPEPNIGFAYNPQQSDGVVGKLFGGGKNVFRGSFTFKNYTEGAQNFWNFGSNNGANYQANSSLLPVSPSPGVTPGLGFYNAGALSLGNATPPLLQVPSVYNPVLTEASQTFTNTPFLTFNPHIKQPYVESWALGVQHQFNTRNVLEVRYVGNVSKEQWLGVNYNEINIFENGYLNEFKKAQQNLAASGGTTFQGEQPLPIMSTAFGPGGGSNFTNGQYITYLQQGQAGAFANSLATNPAYLCSLVGAANFSPCAANGFTGTGNYPINFFEANPYAAGAGIFEMTNDGYSNYNSLQVDFRQRPTFGMQFDANYTLAKSLDNNVQGSLTPGFYGGAGTNGAAGASAPGYYTLRDKALNYGPSIYDVRNVLHVSGTYDLPFGRGRQFLNQNSVANAVIGGWTVGTILSYQSGGPLLFYGQTNTVNTSDSGVVLNNISSSQLQKYVGIHAAAPGHAFVNYFDPKLITSQGQANAQYLSPEYTPGQFGRILWLHDPKWITTDMAVTKIVPLYKEVSFRLQGEFINAFNHTAWNGGDTGVQDTTFGTTNSTANNPRNIELRANVEF